MNRIFHILLATILMWCCAPVWAQRHIVYSDDIASLQVMAGIRWMELPIIKLNGNEPIKIAFDELSHTYRRFTYSVTHLEADFSESQGLFPSDYLAGFRDGITIDDCEESINTTQIYTHYTLELPNDQCRFLMSGNYRLDIKDDNDGGNIIASIFFMVSEDILPISMTYVADTDIDVRKSHQQVELKVDYTPLRATNPRDQIKGYVLQNMRWDNACILPTSSRINQQYLEWTHCRDLIFNAGNEYHKFEILDVNRPSMNVENNAWDGTTWHTLLWPDTRRGSYVYDEAPKGAFFIRNTNDVENDIASEYVNVHFYLQTGEPIPYPVYLNGVWTNGAFDDRYVMQYDEENKRYEAVIPLKYGYYSYQYLMRTPDGQSLIPPTEGSFYETRNIYNALIYYRGVNDRADRLVGHK